MNINTIIKKLKLVLSEKKLNKLGRTTGFMQRERNVSAFQLVIAMIGALGEKDTKYLSDILRYFNQLTGQSVKYKPFHNQLSKSSLPEVMRQISEKVFSYWINDVLKSNKSVFKLFKQINIQDGSSFSVNKLLKDYWPGRFTKISPAAVELHVMMNLKTGSFEQVSLTPDTYSERAEVADVNELSGQLFLADRGYYSGNFIVKLDKAGGYYVLRAKGLKRVLVHQAIVNGKSLIKDKAKPKPISELQRQFNKIHLVDMLIEIEGQLTRVIGLWSLKDKRYTYLVTNLPLELCTAMEITQLYRLRWQIELLFKECKSYNSLHGFNTENASLQEALIWASLISVTLKRFITGCIEQIYQVEMSTMTVSKTTTTWWYGMLEAITRNKRKGLVNIITEATEFLKNNAQRAHPKRDRKTGIYQFGLEPAFYANKTGG